MAADRTRKVERICQAALEREPAGRASFLDDACGGDEALRREVESLLAHERAAEHFFAAPGLEVAAQELAAEAAVGVGRRIGPYQVQSLLGVGGMGEVYRAHDTTLGRDVAIKVLPTVFASDRERLARFEREARVLASLNHPHIAAIYGVERADGHRALVLELVEGPTLADRLAGKRPSPDGSTQVNRGAAIPLGEAVDIARQIAEALEAAHEKGIVHRDLKPANIKVTPKGVVKVLDFGLAKAFGGDASSSDLSQTPMPMRSATQNGRLLGTPAYMSPEQARGKSVDKRSDIWAYGCVLFEMLTGRTAFQGETISDTIASILGGEPDWGALPETTPPRIRLLLHRCLEKDPSRRLRDIADARLELDEESDAPRAAAVVPMVSRRGERLAWASVVALVTVLAAAIAMWPRRLSPPAPEMRLEIATPPTMQPWSLAISPDGRLLVFAGTSDGRSKLWLRSLGGVSARQLDGTDNASYPFWSPDSQSIAFFADGRLRRLDLDRGSVQVLGPAAAGSNGAWNQDGTILLSDGWAGNVLWRVPADGNQPRARIQNSQQSQQGGALNSPVFLPDGRHFLFHVVGPAAGIYIGQLGASDPPKRILDAVAARYASSGHLIFVRQGTLFAQAFDSVRLQLTGDPMVLAEQIFFQDLGMAALSASAAGPIVYRTNQQPTPMGHFVWYDRSGKALEAVAGPNIASFASSLSPDGRFLAYSQNDRGTPGDIWLLDLKRGVSRRFTDDPSFDMFPAWSPDGLRIAFASNRKLRFQLYVKPVDATKPEEPLGGTDLAELPTDWSSDGRFLLYTRGGDIWALDLEGERKAAPVVETMFTELNGQFSPDGHWIAYQSDEAGKVEIYVQPFPGPAPKTRISSEGGFQVRWHVGGRELFYIASDGRLMAVPIRIDSKNLEAGAPVPLFATQFGGTSNDNGRVYMVSRDGQRILLATRRDVTVPITVILNWKPKP